VSSRSAHQHEADACADLVARVTSEKHVFFDLVTGPAPAAIADEAFYAWLNSRSVTREDFDPADWKFNDIPWVLVGTGGAIS
jgi:hypothetical protein